MAYRVELAKNAEIELEELYLWVVERAPSQGAAWFNGLEHAILSLDQYPKRCRIAPESFDPEQPIRVLNYGRSPHVYRVIFTVDERAKSFVSSTYGVEHDKRRRQVISEAISRAVECVVGSEGPSRETL